jgi:hypothetical protein
MDRGSSSIAEGALIPVAETDGSVRQESPMAPWEGCDGRPREGHASRDMSRKRGGPRGGALAKGDGRAGARERELATR